MTLERKDDGDIVYTGLSNHPYGSLDHLIYTSPLITIQNLKLKPTKGLNKLEVPYSHKIVKKQIINEPTYNIWISDHALMDYTIDLQ